MELKLDEAAVQKAVATALMEQLGSDAQAKLVEAAMLYLITPPTGQYNNQNDKVPLQEMFNQAVGNVARGMVADMVKDNVEFQELIKRQVGEAFIKMESTNFSDYLGTALSSALRKDD